MRSPFRVLLTSACLSLVGLGCLPQPCDPVSNAPQSLCHRPDAGEVVPDASFVLEGEVFVAQGQCTVGVDGGQIELSVSGLACSASAPNGARAATVPVRCTIPPLPAGTYTVNSLPPTEFTISTSGDSGVRTCL